MSLIDGNNVFDGEVEVRDRFFAPTVLLSTLEDLTVIIDPDSANAAAAPPAGTKFLQQSDIDDYLTSQSATAFEYIQDFFDVLPFFVRHTVTVNLAGTVHRPKTTGVDILFSRGKIERIGDGQIIMTGPVPSSYDSVHAGGTVRAYQELDEVTGVPDPYVDFDASTFPNDGSLRGYFAVFDNGFSAVIWDHDDSRLWLCPKLNPLPIVDTTTVFVGRPSAILRNSLDDVTQAHSSSIIYVDFGGVAQATFGDLNFAHFTMQDFGSSLGIAVDKSFIAFDSILVEKPFGPLAENGRGLRALRGSLCYWRDCSFLSTVGGGADNALEVSSVGAFCTITCLRSYLQGGDNGSHVGGVDCEMHFVGSVIRGAGGGDDAALSVHNFGRLNLYAGATAVRNTIVDTPSGVPALAFYETSNNFGFAYFLNTELRFRDNLGPCVVLGDNAEVDIGDQSLGFIDDGGNADVGIRVIGPRSTLRIDTNTDVAGTGGEIEIEGVVGDYADIDADSIRTEQLNIISRV